MHRCGTKFAPFYALHCKKKVSASSRDVIREETVTPEEAVETSANRAQLSFKNSFNQFGKPADTQVTVER